MGKISGLKGKLHFEPWPRVLSSLYSSHSFQKTTSHSAKNPRHCLKMAISLGLFSSFLCADKVSFGNSPSYATIRTIPASLRVLRPVTVSAAAKPVTEAKPREPRGIMKPRRVSPEMQAFLGGVAEIPRTQALKEIWAYIKQHNLQVYAYFETLVFGITAPVNILYPSIIAVYDSHR